jgi:hypothetical protein
MALFVPFATAVAVEHLAPRFKSDGSGTRAFRLVAYASTPIWLAGLFYLSIALSRLVLVGVVYAVYLFFAGLTPVMGTPAEQRVPFTLVAILTLLVIQMLLGSLATVVGLPYYGLWL